MAFEKRGFSGKIFVGMLTGTGNGKRFNTKLLDVGKLETALLPEENAIKM